MSTSGRNSLFPWLSYLPPFYAWKICYRSGLLCFLLPSCCSIGWTCYQYMKLILTNFQDFPDILRHVHKDILVLWVILFKCGFLVHEIRRLGILHYLQMVFQLFHYLLRGERYNHGFNKMHRFSLLQNYCELHDRSIADKIFPRISLSGLTLTITISVVMINLFVSIAFYDSGCYDPFCASLITKRNIIFYVCHATMPLDLILDCFEQGLWISL